MKMFRFKPVDSSCRSKQDEGRGRILTCRIGNGGGDGVRINETI